METSETDASRKVIINDLLCFVQNNLKILGVASVQRLCIETYVSKDIQEAFEIIKKSMKICDQADCSTSLDDTKESIMRKICDLFKDEDSNQVQFASSSCNLPRMGVYRDALSVTCLWDDVKELKKIIVEQNRLLSNELHCLYEEFASFKKNQEKLNSIFYPRESSEATCNLSDSLDDKFMKISAGSPAPHNAGDVAQCFIASGGSIDEEQVTSSFRLSDTHLDYKASREMSMTKKTPQYSARFKQRLCSRKDSNRSSAKRQLVTGYAKNVCEICGYTGNTTDVTRHRRTHTGERPFSCPMCSIAFTLRGNMVKHLARKHGTYLSKIPSKRGQRAKREVVQLPPTKPPLMIPTSDRGPIKDSFDVSAGISCSSHNDRHGETPLPSNLSGLLEIKEESILEDLSVYPVSGNDRSSMLTIGMTVDTEEQLNGHSREEIGDVPRSNSTVATYNPMLHMQSMWTDGGHVESWAVGKTRKRHSCDVCGYSGNLTDVTRHKRTHTGERPFACPICDVRFTLRGNMIKHMSRKHDT